MFFMSWLELHLQEYYQRGVKYLQHFNCIQPQAFVLHTPLQAVSPPSDPDGYNNTSILGDMVTEVNLKWVQHMQKPESEQLLRTLTSESPTWPLDVCIDTYHMINCSRDFLLNRYNFQSGEKGHNMW